MLKNQIEIISSSTCPFAQRTRMVLIEKDVKFSLTEIDLNDKPDWFLKISPYGKVPVIRNDDIVIFESAVINEYIEEVFPKKPLLPKTFKFSGMLKFTRWSCFSFWNRCNWV